MMNAKVLEILKQAIALTVEEQRELNTALVDNIKRAHKVQAIQSSAKYSIGDTVIFRHPSKGLIKMRVESFSRDGSKLKGPQLDGLRPGTMWTVGADVQSLKKI